MEQYFIIRCDRSGVFFGEIEKREGREVTIRNARRIWYWAGAMTLSQLAVEGTSQPDRCRFTIVAPSITVLDAIEILPCSERAKESIQGVAVWKM